MTSSSERITSLQNPKVKLVRKLRDKRDRMRENRFVIDDWRDLERALSCGYEIDYVLYTPGTASKQRIDALPHTAMYEVLPELMAKASYRENPSGILAVMKQKPERADNDLAELNEPFILGLVALKIPGNIGALLRSADAAGFKAVFLIDNSLDIYNPNVIRSSTGACFLDNIYNLTSAQALRFFQSNGYQIISAHLEGGKSLFELHFGDKTAIIFGTEDEGLGPPWVENSDELVKIPMVGKISDSLNVSVSGAVFMYEALRQRNEV